MKRDRYAWVTIVPTIWLLICTLTAGWQKIFHSDTKIGFVSHARRYGEALDKGTILAPAKSMDQMRQIIFNDYVDAALAGLFLFVVLSIVVFGIRTVMAARGMNQSTAREAPFEKLPSGAMQ